jgi:shikimate kinase
MDHKNIALSLVGMSGSGKSRWAERLASAGFEWFACDEMIARRLGRETAGPGGVIRALGEWMGYPFDPGYPEREEEYLRCEIEVLTEIFARLKARFSSGGGTRAVVDTTGSVIYAGPAVRGELKELTTVVYLGLTPEAREPMLAKYIAKPRPVLWRGMFAQRPGEPGREALSRCYPLLLDHRERLYRDLCDVELPYAVHSNAGLDTNGFLDAVASLLKGR